MNKLQSILVVLVITPLVLAPLGAVQVFASNHVHVPSTATTTTGGEPSKTITIKPEPILPAPPTPTPAPTPTPTPPPVPTPTPPKIVQCPGGSISVNGSPCPKTKFPCPPSTSNNSQTCIFVIHKNTHTNSVQQVPQAIFIQGLGFVLPIQCVLHSSTQILCNFTMANNGGLLK